MALTQGVYGPAAVGGSAFGPVGMGFFDALKQAECVRRYRGKRDCAHFLDTRDYTYVFEDCPCICVDGLPVADQTRLAQCESATVTDKTTNKVVVSW